MQPVQERRRVSLGIVHVTDLELFDVCAMITLAVYFALSTIQTWDEASRYLFYFGLVVYSGLRIEIHTRRHGSAQTRWTPRWDKNFSLGDFAIIPIGIAGIISISALVSMLSGITSSSLQLSLVPGLPATTLTLFDPKQFAGKPFWQISLFPGDADFPVKPEVLALIPQPVANILQQGLWQTFAVAYGEEGFKLGAILPFAKRFRRPWTIATVIIVTWSVAHSMRAYGGAVVPIIGAIAAGYVLWAVLLLTKSLISAILTHAGVNLLAMLPSSGLDVLLKATAPTVSILVSIVRTILRI